MFDVRGGNTAVIEVGKPLRGASWWRGCFKMYEVFPWGANLVTAATRDVVSKEIKHDPLCAEETGQTVIKEFVQDKLIKKEVKFHGSVKQQKFKTFDTLHLIPFSLDNNKTVAIKADSWGMLWLPYNLSNVDEHLEGELSPTSLSFATPNGSLRKPSESLIWARYCKRMIVRASPYLQDSRISTILESLTASMICAIIHAMPPAIQFLQNTSAAKTVGGLFDKLSTHVTSHFSNKCTRVNVVFDRYLPNSVKGGKKKHKHKGGLSGEIRRNVESSWKLGIIGE